VECARGAWTRDLVAANTPTTFEISTGFLSFDRFQPPPTTVVQPCTLPATTTRIFTRLWSDADAFELTSEFDGAYTFIQ